MSSFISAVYMYFVSGYRKRSVSFRGVLFDICVLLKLHSTDKTRVDMYDAGIV